MAKEGQMFSNEPNEGKQTQTGQNGANGAKPSQMEVNGTKRD